MVMQIARKVFTFCSFLAVAATGPSPDFWKLALPKGRTASALGRYLDAANVYEQALKDLPVQTKDDRLDQALVTNNLAVAYIYQGRYSDAAALCQKAIAMLK